MSMQNATQQLWLFITVKLNLYGSASGVQNQIVSLKQYRRLGNVTILIYLIKIKFIGLLLNYYL